MYESTVLIVVPAVIVTIIDYSLYYLKYFNFFILITQLYSEDATTLLS